MRENANGIVTPMQAPHQLIIDPIAGTLALTWHDGAHGRISHPRLRACCACADCRALALGGRHPEPASDIRVIEVLPVGNYAVQFKFSDGHERGIYPWRYLRELISAEIEPS